MKFSVFLCFLSFTLSFPRLPYKPSFYSDVSIPSVGFFQKFPLFLVQDGSATYIWKFSISVKEITEYGSSHYSADYTDDFIAKLANTLSINWSIIPESVPFELSYGYRIQLTLDTLETYIIIRVNKKNEYSVFYWIGNKSGLVKRQLTARFVVRMMHDVSMQIHGAKLKYLVREEEGKETMRFQKYFNNLKWKQIPRLFKVSGENGQSIMEVPLRKDQLNKTDVFVLDRKKNIRIWNMNPNLSNSNKIGKAVALANYIKNVERTIKKLKILKESGFLSQQIILQHLDNTPSSSQLRGEFSSSTRNEQEQLLLYEFFLLNKRVLSKEIYSRPLTLESFKEDKTYLMIDFRTFNIFACIGLTAHPAQIEQVMAAAEIINWLTPNYKWKKVTIIPNMDHLPAHFLVNFPDKENILQQYQRVKNN